MVVDTDNLGTRCLQLAALCAVAATVFFWGSWILVVIAWAGVVPLALFFGLVCGFVGSWMGAEVQKANVWADDTDLVVTARSDVLVGTFRDAAIHEWIDLKRPDTGESIRLFYERTVPDGRQFRPPATVWFALVGPGILYLQPESATTAGSTAA